MYPRVIPTFILCVATATALLSHADADEPVVIRVLADGSGEYATIQDAIDEAPAGAEIRIGPGVWNEALVIGRPVALVGESWQTTRLIGSTDPDRIKDHPEMKRALELIDREFDGDRKREFREMLLKASMSLPAITIENTKNVRLQGLALLRSEPVRKGSSKGLSTIYVADGGLQMENCAVLESPGNGLEVKGDSDIRVTESLFVNCWSTGIAANISETGTMIVSDSEIRNNVYAGMTIKGSSKSIRIERCRIHGAGWHGIRYEDSSPHIEGNWFHRTAVSGIYASGSTAATVRNNLFLHSGISCWFRNGDTIESNTIVGDGNSDQRGGISQGIQVLGASHPTIHRNLFMACENAVSLSDINSKEPSAKSTGKVNLVENAFWKNKRTFALYDGETEQVQQLAMPQGQLETQPQFVDAVQGNFELVPESALGKAQIGARGFASPESPWPIQPEEARTIEQVEQRLNPEDPTP